MEPVSLAVSIVPLAYNIIEMSSMFRDKVATYKSAEAGIQSIVDRMSLLIEICKHLQDDSNLLQGHTGAGIRDRALGMCYSSVSSIEKELKKVVDKGKGRRQNWEWTLRKSSIDKLSHGLNDSIDMLNAYMGWSVLRSQTVQFAVATTHETTLEPSLAPQEPSALIPTNSRRSKGTKVTETRRTSYQNMFYTYTLVKTSRVEEGTPGERQYRSYLLGLPLLGAYINLATRYGPLSPWSLTLNTPRFIYAANDKQLYVDMVKFGLNGDRSSLSPGQFLQKHNISANTQLVSGGLKDGSNGFQMSFLGAMVALKNTSMVKYLLDQGGRALEDERHFELLTTFEPRNCVRDEELFSDPGFVYARMRGPLLTMAEYHELLKLGGNPEYIEAIFEICKDFFSDDRPLFLHETLIAIASLYSRRLLVRGQPDYNGSPLISKLLALGADISQRFDFFFSRSRLFCFYQPYRPTFSKSDARPMTALSSILRLHQSPVDSLDCAEQWINALKGASVQIDEYLRAELDYAIKDADSDATLQVPVDWDCMRYKTKLEILYDITNPGKRLAQEREDSDDLRVVMPVFQYHVSRWPRLKVDWGAHEEPSHLIWKHERLREPEYTAEDWDMLQWPFQKEPRTNMIEERGWTNLNHWQTKALASHDYYIQLMDERAERRQLNKWRKLKKFLGMTEASKSMPGAWEMEWWEYQSGW